MLSRAEALSAQIEAAERNLEVTRALFEKGLASRSALAEIESQLAALRAEKGKIEANLRLFNASPSKNVFLIRAPATGTVISKTLAPGAPIALGEEPLFSIADLRQVWVLINLNPSDLYKVRVGMPAKSAPLLIPKRCLKASFRPFPRL